MTRASLPRQRLHLSLPTLLLLAGLTGCAAPGPAKAPDSVKTPDVEAPVRPDEPLRMPASAYAVQFQNAESALDRFDWMAAERTLAMLPASGLDKDDLTYRRYLLARSAWLQGDLAAMEYELEGMPTAGTSPALVAKLLNFQRFRLALGGDYLAAADVARQMLGYRPQLADSAELRRDIWLNLSRLQQTELRTARETAADPEWRAWLELALAASSSEDPASLSRFLQDWNERYPGHPATNPLPGGLQPWLDNPAQPAVVALMLPLGGRLAPAAKAVRDGFLASYYRARSAGLADYELLVIDTGLYASTDAAYRSAVAAGAGIVIGPLSKTAVAELGQISERPVPVLALNRPDEPLTGSGGALVQLALAPEDEAHRVAELAFGRGLRRALVVRPSGEWGNDIAAALQAQWQQLGGQLAATASYTGQDSHSGAIKTALNLDASEQRAREVRDMLASNVEFTARRRQDIDVVFLLARSGIEARSLKPLLAYHYAGDLPVFATSSVYSGIPDPRDRDLNGILLVDIPWLLGSNPGLRVAIAAGSTGSDSYTRLNALGADAFLLQSRFSQLQLGADALIRGDTGLLSLNPALQLVRETGLATFEEGVLKPL